MVPSLLSADDTLGVQGILTDVDDTLTQDGKLRPQTYQALWDLQEAGIHVVPVTGRSYGWAHMMLSQWPVDAVIAESGGVYVSRSVPQDKLEPGALQHAHALSPRTLVFFDRPDQVAKERAALMTTATKILKKHPGLRFASDNALRLVDVAIDYCEEVPRVSLVEVQEVIAKLQQAGYQARHSTVHINSWSGTFDKGPMALRFLAERFGLSENEAKKKWLFIGDAPNDQSMFERFPRSVAVANIFPFLEALGTAKPSRMTKASFGAGFEELAQLLLL
jgi:HAD superfamily hydrolase (TIGR01484 family)